jgi:hypothetical protein
MIDAQSSALAVQTDMGRDAALRRPVGAARRPYWLRLARTLALPLAEFGINLQPATFNLQLVRSRPQGPFKIKKPSLNARKTLKVNKGKLRVILPKKFRIFFRALLREIIGKSAKNTPKNT